MPKQFQKIFFRSSPDIHLPAIEVPQGSIGVAEGPNDGVNFVTTIVNYCVAVALVRTPEAAPPQIMLSHIDDLITPHSAAGILLENYLMVFGGDPKDVKAFLRNGIIYSEFFDPLLRQLIRLGCDCYANPGRQNEAKNVRMTIDLRSGHAIGEGADRNHTTFRVGQEFERKMLFARAKSLTGTLVPIFDLRNGVPAFYQRFNASRPFVQQLRPMQ